MSRHHTSDSIVALATTPGISAIAVIRISGPDAIAICDGLVKKDLTKVEGSTVHFASMRDGERIIDEVLLTVFRAPRSFTGEDVVEISTHGSPFIVTQVIQLLIRQGARMAQPGEFTKRGFMNGKMDLAQAEAIADLINADAEVAHRSAITQMRGGFSSEIKALREQLINFASLIELELDFGEEDVEFADRDDLKILVEKIDKVLRRLISSFDLGNVIKNGIATVIVGKPNAGKSTLLNALLNEEKAIVSEIAGTTRDSIEDELNLNGLIFRFIDTAGLRDTEDIIEALGVKRTREKMANADLVLYLFDAAQTTMEELNKALEEINNLNKPCLPIANKTDKASPAQLTALRERDDVILISALEKKGLEKLEEQLMKTVNLENFRTGNTIVTNTRHYEGLVKTQESLAAVLVGLENNVTGDFLAMDIRSALFYLGEITGQITTDDLLANIFSKFCIGK